MIKQLKRVERRRNMMIILIIFMITLIKTNIDYFDTEFDDKKNCKQQDLITKLQKSNDRCASKSKGKTRQINPKKTSFTFL